MTPDDMEGRLEADLYLYESLDWMRSRNGRTVGEMGRDLRALLLDYQERGLALEQTAITLRMLKRNIATEIKRHDGLHRWEGVPEAIQVSIYQAESALTLKGKSHDHP